MKSIILTCLAVLAFVAAFVAALANIPIFGSGIVGDRMMLLVVLFGPVCGMLLMHLARSTDGFDWESVFAEAFPDRAIFALFVLGYAATIVFTLYGDAPWTGLIASVCLAASAWLGSVLRSDSRVSEAIREAAELRDLLDTTPRCGTMTVSQVQAKTQIERQIWRVQFNQIALIAIGAILLIAAVPLPTDALLASALPLYASAVSEWTDAGRFLATLPIAVAIVIPAAILFVPRLPSDYDVVFDTVLAETGRVAR